MQMDPSCNVDLSHNSPGFMLPANMDRLNTRELSLSFCSLRGKIPDSLGSIRGLQYLNLSENQLGGDLPLSVITLVSSNKNKMPFALKENIKSRTKTQGGFTLPANLGDLDTSQMKVLDLSHCSLVGNIPNTIGALQGLEGVNLSFNGMYA